MRSLGHVDYLAFAGKDARPQTQVVVLVASEVRFVRKARIVRVELLGEMNELYDVLRIQTDRSHVSVFVEKVLHHEFNRDVSVV